MTFLALTPLQAGLLAALTAAAIVALYFLKVRHRRVVISSGILWNRVLHERRSQTLWDKFRRILSVVVAVAIGLLIALSLARPQIESLTGPNERIVIVLDTSPTMNSHTGDGETRWRHAIERAKELLASAGPTTQFRIIDTSGITTPTSTTNRNEAREAIDQMSPRTGASRFPQVDGRDSQIYFISDGVALYNTPSFVKHISVFESANNAGITAFEIRSRPATPPGYEAYLEVQNFGRPAEVAVALTETEAQRINKTVRLGTGETYKAVFDLSQFTGGIVRAIIHAKDDALPLDDVAFAYLPLKRKTRTLLVTRTHHFLETFLKLDDRVDLVVTDPAGYRETPDIDVYIFDRFAPSTAPSRPALIIGAPSAPWLKASEGEVQNPEPATWSEEHPVAQHVSFQDISIDRASRIDPGGLTVIAASRQTPLIVASEKPKWVMLTFDLESSDFPFHASFPVFMENVLAWLNGAQLALKRNPGIIEVPLANAQIQTMDGTIVTSDQQLGKTVFEANAAELYSATREDQRLYVAVNWANPTFSDVNRAAVEPDKASDALHYWLRRELWFYMLAAAAVLIAVEWFTYHRRITL